MEKRFKRRYLFLALTAIVLIAGLVYCMDDNKAGIEGNRIATRMAVSEDEASVMFDRVRESVKNEYEDDEDFYCNEPYYNSNGSMGQNMGIFDGVCSKDFSIFYHDGELEVDGYWQR